MTRRFVRFFRKLLTLHFAAGVILGCVLTALSVSFEGAQRIKDNEDAISVIRQRICTLIENKESPDTDGYYDQNCKKL